MMIIPVSGQSQTGWSCKRSGVHLMFNHFKQQVALGDLGRSSFDAMIFMF